MEVWKSVLFLLPSTSILRKSSRRIPINQPSMEDELGTQTKVPLKKNECDVRNEFEYQWEDR